VGLDEWLILQNGYVGGSGPIKTSKQTFEWYREALRLEESEFECQTSEDGTEFDFFITVENGIWTVGKRVYSAEIEFAPKISFEDKNGGQPPRISGYFELFINITIFQKMTIEISEICPGETVKVECVFFVPEENAPRVRIDDWIYSGRSPWTPDIPEENVPFVIAEYDPFAPIRCKFTASLEKCVNGRFERAADYERTWESWYSGCGFLKHR